VSGAVGFSEKRSLHFVFEDAVDVVNIRHFVVRRKIAFLPFVLYGGEHGVDLEHTPVTHPARTDNVPRERVPDERALFRFQPRLAERNLEDIRAILSAGADKITINTAAVQNPGLVAEAAGRFGSQCIVVAIDARQAGPDSWEVYIHGGRTPTGIDAVGWARQVEVLGAGEIMLTSMDRDGTKDGYDIPLTRAIVRSLNIPVIASGGVGNLEHIAEGLTEGEADAALAASIFHFGEYSIKETKEYLRSKGVPVRI